MKSAKEKKKEKKKKNGREERQGENEGDEMREKRGVQHGGKNKEKGMNQKWMETLGPLADPFLSDDFVKHQFHSSSPLHSPDLI